MRNVRIATVETFELRRLMSAVALVDGTIVITGTAGGDRVVVATNAATQKIDVTFNGAASSFPIASVQKVWATLGSGNDWFDATATGIRAWVDAEAGNDVLLGGSGNDCLIGGLDNDSIDGGLGDDSLSGSGGKDYLYGGMGRDRVDGGRSNDIVRGGPSNDRLMGGDGADLVFGDGGDDRFYCNGIYSDTIYGGAGVDTACVDHDDALMSIENPIFD